jgi:hypothetical protein
MNDGWEEGFQDGVKEGWGDCLRDLNIMFNLDMETWDDMLEYLRTHACFAEPGRD